MSARSSIAVLAALTMAVSTPVAYALVRTDGPSGKVWGWIVYAGGPHRSIQARRLDGKVVVRDASGRIIRRIQATKRHGFVLTLSPGRYKLSPIVIDMTARGMARAEACPAESPVSVRRGTSVHVELDVNCLVP
jgi:hypothetical protein